MFLSPTTSDDIVSMAAVITHIRALAEQLENLTELSGELPEQTGRYYGMFVLLMYAIDRVQTRFIQDIDHILLPRLSTFEQEAAANILDARRQIAGGGPAGQLKANIEAAGITQDACRLLAGSLREQRGVVMKENLIARQMFLAAQNTYKTVRLSLSVADLMRDSRQTFQALRQIQFPHLRPSRARI